MTLHRIRTRAALLLALALFITMLAITVGMSTESASACRPIAGSAQGAQACSDIADISEGSVKALRTWNPCRFEDGSGQHRCIWKGNSAGNGEGISLKIFRGGEDNARYIEITHKRARVLLNR